MVSSEEEIPHHLITTLYSGTRYLHYISLSQTFLLAQASFVTDTS